MKLWYILATAVLMALAMLGVVMLRIIVEFVLSDKVFELNDRGISMAGDVLQITLFFLIFKCMQRVSR